MSVLLLVLGLFAPASGAEALPVPAGTVTARLDGLPAAAQAAGATTGGLQVSRPVPTPIPFSLVGLRMPEGAAAQLRTSNDGRTWTEWEEVDVHPDESPDPGRDEAAAGDPGWSLPVWVGEARWVQVRATGTGLAQIGVQLVDSSGLSRSWARRAADSVRTAWSGPAAAHATVDGPPVVSRAEWGADESLRRRGASYARRNRFGLLHHTAGTSDYSKAEAPGIVRGVYAYHVKANGWNDIGYNLLVDRFGTVYEGRHGGLEEAVIGAHAGGFNTGSFGVAVLGTFSGAAPPHEALESLARVFAWKFDLHHVDVAGAVMATSAGSSRYPSGQTVRLATLSGHRDVSATACPGGELYELLPALRHRVLELGGDMLLDHHATPGSLTVVGGRSLEGPVALSVRLRPAGQWQVEVRDPSGHVIHRDAGEGEMVTSSWTPRQAAAGRYTYTFSSPGRRSASDWIELSPPSITDATASPRTGRIRDGRPSEAVVVTATTYPDAPWTVTISDAAGGVVHRASGRGEQVATRWEGPATTAGTYTWEIDTPDTAPARGTIELFADVLHRIATAGGAPAATVALSREAFPVPRSATRAVLARMDLFADALAGGPLAGTAGPVLLTDAETLDAQVSDELDRVLPAGATVYVLGGEQALSKAVVAALEDRWHVERLAGAERTATAAAVAAEVLAGSGTATALVARAGPDHAMPWADALAGGAYGAAEGIPVLLTDSATLSPATSEAIADLGIRRTIVLGGTAAVSESVLSALPDARRVAGSERAATAVEVARQLWGRTSGAPGDRFVLVAGLRSDAWTLALAASPLAARHRAPLVLADAERLPAATVSYLDGLRYGPGHNGEGWVLGGESLVGPAVADTAAQLLQ